MSTDAGTQTQLYGANPVLPPERVGCGKPITGYVYRCTECTTPFHHECAIKHFGQHGEIVVTDTTYELLLAEKNDELTTIRAAHEAEIAALESKLARALKVARLLRTANKVLHLDNKSYQEKEWLRTHGGEP